MCLKQVSVASLLEYLCHENLIKVFSSILLERRIIFIARQLGLVPFISFITCARTFVSYHSVSAMRVPWLEVQYKCIPQCHCFECTHIPQCRCFQFTDQVHPRAHPAPLPVLMAAHVHPDIARQPHRRRRVADAVRHRLDDVKLSPTQRHGIGASSHCGHRQRQYYT